MVLSDKSFNFEKRSHMLLSMITEAALHHQYQHNLYLGEQGMTIVPCHHLISPRKAGVVNCVF